MHETPSIRPRWQRRIPLDVQLHCPNCGYDLRGIPEGRCPECGFGFDAPAIADLTLRAALLVEEAYREIRFRALWLIFGSLGMTAATQAAPALPHDWQVWVAPVVLAAALLHREYGPPRSWWELLVDWGLPLSLIGTAPFSGQALDLVQWGMVAELVIRAWFQKNPFPGSPSVLSAPGAARVRRVRGKVLLAIGLGASVAWLV